MSDVFRDYLRRVYGRMKCNLLLKLHKSAAYVSEIPNLFNDIGAIYISEEVILIHTETFANFIDTDPSNVRKVVKAADLELKKTIRNEIFGERPELIPYISKMRVSMLRSRTQNPFSKNLSDEDIKAIFKFNKTAITAVSPEMHTEVNPSVQDDDSEFGWGRQGSDFDVDPAEWWFQPPNYY